MHSDRYVHPEFGLLSPTPRLRRELRTAFFSVLFGIGIGAAAVIALSGNNADDARVSHGVSSASVTNEQPTEAVLGYNSPQAAGIEKETNKDHTSEPDRSTAETNAENHKTNATTTCWGNNSSCGSIPHPGSKPRAMRMPAANDALAIGRVPLGRPDASVPPSMSSERAPEHSTAGRSEEAAVDRLNSNRLTHNKPHKTARSQNQPRQDAPNSREGRAAFWTGRGYERPVGESRAYALDRFGPKGFWDWSR
jgi:hypothetical protein